MTDKTVIVRLLAETKQYEAAMAKASRSTTVFGASGTKSLDSYGHSMTQLGANMTKTVTPAALSTAAAFGMLHHTWDQAEDALRAGTGKTGAELDALTDSLKNIAGEANISMGQLGNIMAEVASRTGQTGAPLEKLTSQIAQLEELGNKASVESLTRAFGDWSISTDRQSESLDYMFKASQQSGVGVQRLAELVVQFGAPLRELGFGFEESIALMARFEKEGVNTQTVMAGMRFAVGKWGKDGKKAATELRSVIDQINNAGSASEANAIALENFGRRGFVDLARAVKEGRFELTDFMTMVGGSSETIESAAEDTRDLADQLQMLANGIAANIGPWSQYAMVAAGVVAVGGPLIAVLGGTLRGIVALPTAIAYARAAMVAQGAAMASMALRGGAATAVVAGLAVAIAKAKQNSEEAKAAFDAALSGVDERIANDPRGPLAAIDAKLAVARDALEASQSEFLLWQPLEWDQALLHNQELESMLDGRIASFETYKAEIQNVMATEGLSENSAAIVVLARRNAKDATDEAAESEGELAGVLAEAARQGKEAADAMDDLTKSYEDWVDQSLSMEDASLNFEEAYDALIESVREHGTTLDDEGKGGRENIKMLRDLADAAREAGYAALFEGQSEEQAAAAMHQKRDAMVALMTQMGFNEAQIYTALTQYHLTDAAIASNTARYREQVIALEDARLAMVRFIAESARIGLVSNIAGFFRNAGFGHGRAHGGPVAGGSMYPVTELGQPEMLTTGAGSYLMMPPGASGYVTPASALGGGGGGSIDYDRLAQAVARVMPTPQKNFNFPNYIGSQRDLEKFLVKAARENR